VVPLPADHSTEVVFQQKFKIAVTSRMRPVPPIFSKQESRRKYNLVQ